MVGFEVKPGWTEYLVDITLKRARIQQIPGDVIEPKDFDRGYAV
jgi:hypothetical protein